MSIEFAGQLFDTEARRLRAIAQTWLTGDGLNGAADIHQWMDTLPAAALARECIDGWWSGDAADTAPDPDDLAGAFADLAANREWLTG